MLRAASLKSNNASLAKKVAELQLELGAQRTAAREAAIESCRLQMQVARFQPLLEARDQLKDSLLQLRELLATMLDTDMAVMRCVNEMASIVEGPENGGISHSPTLLHGFPIQFLRCPILYQILIYER
ncbi:hypothetical protein FGIG_12479 [Fasciola gigantica]|uniref:Uncharacterized protein n=1 Tax=Fasciola gigantica TaxID=46835 RepID=A0A504Y8E3_FASGI|nr:hypothetical protein FGIG_12479 [Fasciola gigantica]